MYNRRCEYFVINDDVAECVKKVKKIIPAECDFCPKCGSDNRPKIHGCSFADETCKNNPCADCGLREGDEK